MKRQYNTLPISDRPTRREALTAVAVTVSGAMLPVWHSRATPRFCCPAPTSAL